MNKILMGGLAALGLAGAAVAVVVQTGLVDVSADTPHSPLVFQLIDYARERAIARRLAAIQPPADLADAGRVRRGAGNYDAMCAGCHLAPGVDNSEIRQGLYPTPPNLTRPADAQESGELAAARQFWIIKHGLKASGMPAWSKGGMEDAALWDLVAFLRVLPTLSAAQYRAVVAASEGHSHGGIEHHHTHASDAGGDDVAHAEHAHADGDGHAHGHAGHAD